MMDLQEYSKEKRAFRKEVASGLAYALVVVFVFSILLTQIPMMIFGGGFTRLLSGFPHGLVIVLLALIMLPLIAYINGMVLSYFVVFGLWVKESFTEKTEPESGQIELTESSDDQPQAPDHGRSEQSHS